MSSVDGASDRSCTLECDQETENNDKIVVKVEMQEPGRRGSATTPVDLGALTKSGAKPANNRPVSSIESDEVYEPVTPKMSSVNGAGRGRGQGRKKAISKKLRGVKVSTDKVLKTRQSFKDTKKGLKGLGNGLLDETLAEDDDYDWQSENEHGTVRSDDNTWDQVDKVIGSAGKPTHPNGRAEGRKLVAWHRTRMMEKLILNMAYECRRADLILPWDKIAHRLCPSSSGLAAQQFINRLRDILITEGHLVPPPLGALGKKSDSSIRGYIRDMNAQDPKTTRAVGWNEEIVDLKESLVVPGISRGSGTYRRDKRRQKDKSITVEGTPTKQVRTSARANKQLAKAKSELKKKTTKVKKERCGSIDPAGMPSDEDYDPRNRLNINGYRRRKVAVKKARKYDDTDEDMDESTESEDEPSKYFGNEPCLEETLSERQKSENHAMTPLATLPIMLKLSPDVLRQFPEDIVDDYAQTNATSAGIEDYGDYEGVHDDAETAFNSPALNSDDDLDLEDPNFDNDYDLQLQAQHFYPSNNYVEDTSDGYNQFRPRLQINAPEYHPVYHPRFDNHNYIDSGTASFENSQVNNVGISGIDDPFLDMHHVNVAFGLQENLNFGDPNDMMQVMNGGQNDMHAISYSTGISSGNSSFAHPPANTQYDGSQLHCSNANMAAGQSFESAPQEWNQDTNAAPTFIQDQGFQEWNQLINTETSFVEDQGL